MFEFETPALRIDKHHYFPKEVHYTIDRKPTTSIGSSHATPVNESYTLMFSLDSERGVELEHALYESDYNPRPVTLTGLYTSEAFTFTLSAFTSERHRHTGDYSFTVESPDVTMYDTY